MTDSIGTAQEREVDRLITLMREAPGQLGNSELEYLADALESRIAEVGRLEERVRELEAERTGCWVVTCSLCGCTNAHMDTCPNRTSLQRRV